MKKIIFLFLCFFCLLSVYAQPKLLSVDDNSEKEFSIFYDLNGGVNSDNPLQYNENEEITLTNPIRDGYIFDGWYFDSSFTEELPFNQIKNLSGSIKIYAKWIKEINFSDFEKENMVEVIPIGKKVSLENFGRNPAPVDITSYSISKYEVTQDLFESIMGVNPSYFKNKPQKGEVQELRPVENITWYDAILFCNKLTCVLMSPDDCYYTIHGIGRGLDNEIIFAIVSRNQDKKGYRLPSVEEWEMAARGGVNGGWDYKFPGSDSCKEVAWYDKNSRAITHQIGLKKGNSLDIYDMGGNVAEWCWRTMLFNETRQYVWISGGHFRNGDYYCEVDDYIALEPYSKSPGVGFRLCRSLIE